MERVEGMNYVELSHVYIRKSEDLRVKINKSLNEMEILEMAIKCIALMTGDTLFSEKNIKKIKYVKNYGFCEDTLAFIYRNFYERAVKEAIEDLVKKNLVSKCETDLIEYLSFEEWKLEFSLYIQSLKSH